MYQPQQLEWLSYILRRVLRSWHVATCTDMKCVCVGGGGVLILFGETSELCQLMVPYRALDKHALVSAYAIRA